MSEWLEQQDLEQPAGSSDAGEPAFLVVGKLRRPHGLRGEMLMEVFTDFPERLQPKVTVYAGEELTTLHIRSSRPHGQGILLAFDGYDSPESVGIWRNKLLYVRGDDRPPLPDGEYYQHQLLGLQVIGEDNQTLGHLTQILYTGANDVFVVQPPDGPEILVPAVDQFILEIDLERAFIRVRLIPGMLSE
jgi:16S rRNA processing protein RimM